MISQQRKWLWPAVIAMLILQAVQALYIVHRESLTFDEDNHIFAGYMMHKTADFEQYARRWPEPIKRCGGDLIGYFLPTKFAGPTNVAYALIRFANLTAYEKYREALGKDPDAIANVAAAEASRCILVEDRSFLQRVPE